MRRSRGGVRDVLSRPVPVRSSRGRSLLRYQTRSDSNRSGGDRIRPARALRSCPFRSRPPAPAPRARPRRSRRDSDRVPIARPRPAISSGPVRSASRPMPALPHRSPGLPISPPEQQKKEKKILRNFPLLLADYLGVGPFERTSSSSHRTPQPADSTPHTPARAPVTPTDTPGPTAMTITAAERAEINRQNSRRSTGQSRPWASHTHA